MTRRKRFVVWKSAWLPASETFIRSQTESVPEWEPIYVGSRRLSSGIGLQSDRILYGEGLRESCWRRAFSVTGLSLRLRAEIQRSDASLIHAHFANDGMLVAQTLQTMRQRPRLMVTLHGSDITALPRLSGLRGLRYRWRLRRLFRQADAFIAVSWHIRSRAIALGCRPDKVFVHHTGARWRPQPTDRSRLGVIAVGRLVEKKGFDDLIRAAGILRRRGISVPVTIIGSGELLNELQDLNRREAAEVTFAGPLPQSEVIAALEGALVACVPSKIASNGDEEGLPTVLIEAAMAGCAIVATRHSGIPDAISSAEYGILIEESSPVELASALEALFAHPDQAARLGSAAAGRMKDAFNIEVQGEQLGRLYDRLSAANSS